MRKPANIPGVLAIASLVSIAFAAGTPGRAATDGIGQAERVVETVRSVVPTRERRLVVNDDVFRDDIVETADRSAARLVFHDDTYLSMGPNSRLQIANLPVAGDASQSFVVKAAEGVFKFVSGNLRSDQYRIETPAATIGIRGTIVWLTVNPDRTTEVASQVGEVIVCNEGECVNIKRGQYTRTAAGSVPDKPSAIPAAFHDRIRDMVIRLLLASSGPDDLFSTRQDVYDTPSQAEVAGNRAGPRLQPPPQFRQLPNSPQATSETPAPEPIAGVTDVPIPGTSSLLFGSLVALLLARLRRRPALMPAAWLRRGANHQAG